MKTLLLIIGTCCLMAGSWAVGVQPDGIDFEKANKNLENQIIAVDGSDVSFTYGKVERDDGSEVPYFEVFRLGESISGIKETTYRIKLRHGDFDPFEGVPPVDGDFQGGADVSMYIVQFRTSPQEVYRQQITQLGGQVSWYLPNHAHLVKMDAKAFSAVAALPYVRWIGVYHPAYRMEEFLLKNHEDAEQVYPLQTYNIMVHESGLGQKSAVAQKIAGLGGAVDVLDAGKYLVRATLTPQQLFRVVRYDEVLFVDRWGPYEKDMNNAREYGGANYIEVTPAPPGYTGQGVRGEVFDAGFNVSHGDFASRPLIEHTTPGVDSHGAATSGICFGDGTGNPDARGLLPSGQGIVANYQGLLGEPARYAFTGELVQAPYYAVFQTSSVGSPRTFFYNTVSADTDAALFDFDIVHCQSQSNAGNQDSRPEAWAKNIISGGGVRHYDTLDPSDDCWCSGASIGPAQDGRIKPDLCAYYDSILTTTTGGTTAYTTGFGGTSGATPIICGHVGLIFQMWHEGIFGNPTPGATVFDNRCHMTTAKALLINSAQQYAFTGTGHDLTRVHQGWGFPDLQNLYDLRDKLVYVDETDLLDPFGMNAYTIDVSAGEPAFKATLVYADPPGNPAASQQRINDLTLKVTSPSGVVYWGNHGLLEGNWSTPGGGPNVVDTVENVFVPTPEEGVWSVQVFGDDIVEDSHVETPAVDADYALIVTGGVQVPGFVMSVDPSAHVICAGEDAVYNLDFVATMGFSEQVDLDVTGVPIGSTGTFGQDPITPPASTTLTISSGAPCMGDLDGDNDVDFDDLMMACGVWLESHVTGDANDNGWVELMDMVWISDNFGPCSTSAEDGLHVLNITGTATALTQTGQPTLHLSSGVPNPPVLTTPANGAIEVSREPSFAWDAEPEAVDYHIQVALDAGFTNIVHEETVVGTTFDMPFSLGSITQYFWHVRGNNGCGEGNYGGAFSFTTIDQPDYMTEQFTSGVDLDAWTVRFIPNGAGDFYDHCGVAAAALPTDPAGGNIEALTDDGSATVNLTTPVSFYGVQYSTVYINANGNVTFDAADSDYTESLTDHFDQPRISGVFDDLGPHQGSAEVSWKETADRLAITYLNVPQLGAGDINTFQFEILYNGEIHVTWLQTDGDDAVSGLSEGNGLPADFVATDLSAAPPCTK